MPGLRRPAIAGRQTLVRVLLVFAAVAATLLPLGLLRAQDIADGLIVARSADAVSFHPYKTTDTTSGDYQGLVYANSLLERDPQDVGRFVGNLDERWTVSDEHLT
jgi:hypothetical protein